MLSAGGETFKFDPALQFLAFNLDGRDFIGSKIKFHLVEMLNYRVINEMTELLSSSSSSKFYVLMNLPAMSIEFLDAFRGLYSPAEAERIRQHLPADLIDRFRLHIFCYHFCKGEDIELDKLKQLVRVDIFGDEKLAIESKYVRKVAPSKNMYCSMFAIGFEHMFKARGQVDEAGDRERIKHRIDEIVDGFYERGAKIKKTE